MLRHGNDVAGGPTTSAQWSTVLPSAPLSTAQEVTLQFPTTADTVFISGYDTKTQMVRFALSKWVPGGEGRFAHADIHVDATDHIDAISERYAP